MNQFEQLQRDARKSEREWKAYVRQYHLFVKLSQMLLDELYEQIDKWVDNH